jgi:hemerythrin-like domain-containing protein
MDRPSCTLPGVAGDLLRIHNICTRALDNAVRHVGHHARRGTLPDRPTRRGLLRYVRTLHAALHSHHLTEDELAFPAFESRMPDAPFDVLTEQHGRMAVLLERISDALTVLESGSDAALLALARELEALQDLWLTHIAIEEDLFTSEVLDAISTPEEQAELARRFAKHGQDHGGPGPYIVPFFLFHLDPAERAILASHMPWMLVKVLVPYAWRRAWKPMVPYFPRFEPQPVRVHVHAP